MVTALSCHSSCSYCDGPTENDCLVCHATNNPNQIPVNGKCECDSGSNGAVSYLWADGVCHGNCDTSDTSIVYYAD